MFYLHLYFDHWHSLQIHQHADAMQIYIIHARKYASEILYRWKFYRWKAGKCVRCKFTSYGMLLWFSPIDRNFKIYGISYVQRNTLSSKFTSMRLSILKLRLSNINIHFETVKSYRIDEHISTFVCKNCWDCTKNVWRCMAYKHLYKRIRRSVDKNLVERWRRW